MKNWKELPALAKSARSRGIAVTGGSNGGGWCRLAIACGFDGYPTKDQAKRFMREWKAKNHVSPARQLAKEKSGPIKVSHPIGMTRAIEPNSPEFLWSYEWRRLRMQVLRHYGARCQCCGASPAEGAVMNVDHIKPRKFFPELAFDFDNLQVLCHECNHGKANNDQTDWRPEEVDHEVVSMLRSIANGQ